MCVAMSALDALESLGDNIPFTLEPILLELEGGLYIGPILLGDLQRWRKWWQQQQQRRRRHGQWRRKGRQIT